MKNLPLFLSLLLLISILVYFNFFPFFSKNRIKDTFKSDEIFLKGIKYLNMGKQNEGILLLKELVRIQPEYAINHFYLGYFLYIYGEIDSSIFYFKNCIKKDQEFYDAYFFLGKALIQKGDFENGYNYLKTAVHLNPYFLDAYKEIAKYLLMIGDLKGFDEIQRRIGLIEGKR